MRELIKLYALQHGAEDTLTEVGCGFQDASYARSTYTKEGKQLFVRVATALFQLRNEVRKES
jgi:hypothetical protein